MPKTRSTILPAMTISATDVDNLVNLMRTVNYKLLFDLNLLLRYGIQWDPTNTADLLGYVNKMKYHDVFNFELGNGKILHSEYKWLVFNRAFRHELYSARSGNFV